MPGLFSRSLLRKYADLQIERPAILLDQRQHAFEAAQADHRIDFDVSAHVADAVPDRALQRAACARVHIFRGERRFQAGDFAYRFIERSGLRPAAIEDAGLVQVHVRFDQARSSTIVRQDRSRGPDADNPRSIASDAPGFDADIDEIKGPGTSKHAPVAKNQIHVPPRSNRRIIGTAHRPLGVRTRLRLPSCNDRAHPNAKENR